MGQKLVWQIDICKICIIFSISYFIDQYYIALSFTCLYNACNKTKEIHYYYCATHKALPSPVWCATHTFQTTEKWSNIRLKYCFKSPLQTRSGTWRYLHLQFIYCYALPTPTGQTVGLTKVTLPKYRESGSFAPCVP